MCSTPSMPKADTAEQKTIATPTLADIQKQLKNLYLLFIKDLHRCSKQKELQLMPQDKLFLKMTKAEEYQQFMRLILVFWN